VPHFIFLNSPKHSRPQSARPVRFIPDGFPCDLFLKPPPCFFDGVSVWVDVTFLRAT
jgi:hypothetical protein